MDKQRQKYLRDLCETVEKVNAKVSELIRPIKGICEECISELQTTINKVEAFKDEQQDVFDNMSERQQEGEKGQVVYDGINCLNSAVNSLENLLNEIEAIAETVDNTKDKFDEAIEHIDNAKEVED